jgi:hypothetical protein
MLKTVGKSFLVCCATMLIGVFAGFETTSFAEDNNNNDVFFSELDESEKVLRLPDGGFLHGKATIRDSENRDIVIAEYDSSTDPNSVTVGDVRKGREEFPDYADNILPARATPPSNPMELWPQATYNSDMFSGSGWRFSGFVFYPKGGNGLYLRWITIFDDGVVGSLNQAHSTYNGSFAGQILYKDYYQLKYTGTTSGDSVFYTLNPVPGQKYTVANKELTDP